MLQIPMQPAPRKPGLQGAGESGTWAGSRDRVGAPNVEATPSSLSLEI